MIKRKLKLFKTPIGRLRAIALIEGISYLILLGIAMPLKYFAEIPQAVRIAGSVHGVLFILFCLALAHVILQRPWPLLHSSLIFLSSLVPFGNFLIDSKLKREDLLFMQDSQS